MAGRAAAGVRRGREIAAWELRQQGWSSGRIASELGVARSTVWKMLARVDRRALAQFEDQVMRQKVEQTEQLQQIVDEALQAWERSKQDVEMGTTTTGRAHVSRGGNVVDLPDLAVTQRRPQNGNPAFLAQALRALSGMREIWGLNAPRQRELDGKDRSSPASLFADLSDEELERRIAEAEGEMPLGEVPEEA